MSKQNLSIREMNSDDLEIFINYWLNATPEFLTKMGVDVSKRPNREQLYELVTSQFKVPVESKKNYFLTWLINNEPVGCSNINQIELGKQAFIHLHLWETENRQKGLGFEFIKMSIPYYFDSFNLQYLFCEPYALNLAPNRTVEKLGFQLMKTYTTTPGASNFEQLVNQWRISKNDLL